MLCLYKARKRDEIVLKFSTNERFSVCAKAKSIDINDELDFQFAEYVLSAGLVELNCNRLVEWNRTEERLAH